MAPQFTSIVDLIIDTQSYHMITAPPSALIDQPLPLDIHNHGKP